jgi:hypothetical protein
MQDSVGQFVAHRNTGISKHIQYLFVTGIGRVGARIHQDSDFNPGVVSGDYFTGKGIVLHEPESHIDFDSFIIDKSPERLAAVFK